MRFSGGWSFRPQKGVATDLAAVSVVEIKCVEQLILAFSETVAVGSRCREARWQD